TLKYYGRKCNTVSIFINYITGDGISLPGYELNQWHQYLTIDKVKFEHFVKITRPADADSIRARYGFAGFEFSVDPGYFRQDDLIAVNSDGGICNRQSGHRINDHAFQ